MHFATSSNVLLEPFVPNLSSLTHPSPHILGKIQTNMTRETKQSQKCLTMTSCRQIVTSLSGAQPEIFQGRGGFVELEHSNKCFVKNTRKKAVQGKIFELFPLDTLITTF